MTIDLRDLTLPASAVRDALGLSPHPEGGHYRELWRDRPQSGERGAGTSILFMLAAGERSHWHRVDAAEVWLWHAGAPLLLGMSAPGTEQRQMRLGPDLSGGERLQSVVPAHVWQDARSLGAWTVVSCVVAPAFEFAGFEMAPQDWSPAGGI
ncbi:MAG: cupin domain-containing protein [Acetobacteraceae bacterium]